MLVVDYLQLMAGSRRGDNRAAEVSEISRGLKIIAKDLDIPVLAVSQLNRSSEIKGDRPKLSELRESGSIEQDADVVMLLWRENHESQIVEVNIAKQRSGPTAKRELAFIARYTSFECLAQETEDTNQAHEGVA
jgi:replicative DNA helicase